MPRSEHSNSDEPPRKVRLDRWLWAARFFKTRAQAKTAIDGGKVQLQGARPKAAREIVIGDEVRVRRGRYEQTVIITGLSDQRRDATHAATLYTETDDSIEQREIKRARGQMERAGLRMPSRRPNREDRRARSDLKRDDADPRAP